MIEKEGIDVFQYRDNSGDYHYVTKDKRALNNLIYLCNTAKDGSGEDYLRLFNQISQINSTNGKDFVQLTKEAVEELCKAENPVFYIAKGYDNIKNELLRNPNIEAVSLSKNAMVECRKIDRVYYIY